MATNEEMRRASGAAMEQARRQNGRNLEQQRRAGGQAMIERRTGQSEASDINALIEPPRQRKTLGVIEPRGGIPSQRGRGTYQEPTTGQGGGIASPLTEASAAAREYWPVGLTSSDGLFMLPAIKKLTLTDANNAEVIVELANPVGTA